MTQTNSNTDPSASPAPSQTPASVLDQLVGPGKKFDNVESLAKGKAESDAFIDSLKRENGELRNLVQGLSSKVDQLAARASILNQLDPDVNANGNQSVQPNSQPSATPQVAGISADDVRKLIEASENDKTAKSNLRKVDEVLIKQFGAEAPALVKQRASELGLPVEELLTTAAKAPNAFFAMIGVNPNGASSNGSMYRPSGGGNDASAPAVRNETFYNNLKAKMGATKFAMDKNIQIQLHKDMQALGDAYFT